MLKVLIIGYGNPGRLDDGLGPALAERFQGLEKQAESASERFQALELQNPPRPAATPPEEGIFQSLEVVGAGDLSRHSLPATADDRAHGTRLQNVGLLEAVGAGETAPMGRGYKIYKVWNRRCPAGYGGHGRRGKSFQCLEIHRMRV